MFTRKRPFSPAEATKHSRLSGLGNGNGNPMDSVGNLRFFMGRIYGDL